jgi:hypothetical protein
MEDNNTINDQDQSAYEDEDHDQQGTPVPLATPDEPSLARIPAVPDPRPEPARTAAEVPEFARRKKRSLDGSTLTANAAETEDMEKDILPWEVPLKVVLTDEEPQPLADEGEEADEPPVECAAIRVVKRGPAQPSLDTYRLTVRKTHEPKTTRDGNPYISASAMYSRFVGENEEHRTWVLITAFGATAAKALLQVEPGAQGEFTGRLTSKMGEYEGVPQRQWYLAIGGR